jgi:hypothetical protein
MCVYTYMCVCRMTLSSRTWRCVMSEPFTTTHHHHHVLTQNHHHHHHNHHHHDHHHQDASDLEDLFNEFVTNLKNKEKENNPSASVVNPLMGEAVASVAGSGSSVAAWLWSWWNKP